MGTSTPETCLHRWCDFYKKIKRRFLLRAAGIAALPYVCSFSKCM
jgi:hypothetical protein